jgi:hypothetical protein
MAGEEGERKTYGFHQEPTAEQRAAASAFLSTLEQQGPIDAPMRLDELSGAIKTPQNRFRPLEHVRRLVERELPERATARQNPQP